MKFKQICVFVLLIFILTIGVVSANDANQTDQISNDDTDIILQSSDRTFTDLNNNVSNSESELNIISDYTFNKTGDANYASGIVINHKNLVINGNNHVIDAKSNARIFTVNASNITINNLVLKNANDSAIFLINSTLITNNVTFENNVREHGGAVYGENSTFISVDDAYTDNYADLQGAAIYLKANSKLYLLNASFKSQKELQWGLINLIRSQFTIVNTTFSDIKSKYCPVLHVVRSNGTIQGCSFLDLYANLSAGALAFDDIADKITIDNCTFMNLTSSKNAGAVLFIGGEADPSSGERVGSIYGTCIISDSQFINCSSQFGGAVMHLNGILSVDRCNFTENCAVFMGAGIYTSYTNITVNNTDLNKNVIIYPGEEYNSGGAIFCDKGVLIVNYSSFSDNFALSGGAISLYDSNYTISNSNFTVNNTNNTVYSIFDGKTAVIDDSNSFNENNTNILNETDYVYVNQGWGKRIDYEPIILDENLVNESYFNLVDYGLVTSVRDQGSSGSCWAFGSAAALESAFLKATNKTLVLDISENNIKSIALKYYFYGIYSSEGSSEKAGAAYFLSWLGVVNSEDDEYDELGRISAVFNIGDKYHIYDFAALPRYETSLINEYKSFLVKYGALATSVHGADGGISGDYNDKTYGAYYKRTSNEWSFPDHVITLVGWNDSYSRYNFNQPAPGDGAWIIKNSWGSDWGDNGYYYVSYYDDLFGRSAPFGAIGYIVNNNHNYEKVYQYDISADVSFEPGKMKDYLTPEEREELEKNISAAIAHDESLQTSTVGYANIFEAVDNDLIAAVGTYFNDSDVDYSITISVNDEIVHTQSGKSSWMGYETIRLTKYIPIKTGDLFKINITSNQVPLTESRLKIKEGMTLSNMTEGTWQVSTHLAGSVACIKAYTIPVPSNFSDLNESISQASNQLDLSSDYIFVQTDDGEFKNGIIINGKNLTINGNGHCIDANTLAGIFNITDSNVTIINLIIKNAAKTAVIAVNSTFKTNNVTFIANVAEKDGGAVYISNANYTSAGDRFIDNYAPRFGSAISVKDNSALTVINSTFKGSDMYWGLIGVEKSQFNIINATFANSTSRYSTAMYSEGGKGKITNSKFINLTASITAGALAFKEFEGTVTVENSIFADVKSSKNAGAVFVDVIGADSEFEGIFTVTDSQFINCSSEFGGAILQLTGNLTIADSNFTDNYASENGGAVYTSWANAEIDNVLFLNNSAGGNGGAIFFDKALLTVKNSNFTANNGVNGGAIYIYDSSYNISGSYFKSNIENVYSMFEGEIKEFANNNVADGKNNLGNADYKYSYEIKNINLDYNPITYDLSLADMSYFDLRDLGLVTSAKAQGWIGSCWTFASAAALESAILKATNKSVVLDISENDLRNNALQYGIYGGDSAEGGDGQKGGQYFISFGAVTEDMDTYDELGKISKVLGGDRYYLFKLIQIPRSNNISDIHIFKEALVKYGALSIGVVSHDRSHVGDYNNETYAAYYYSDGNQIPDHQVTLVGWDDNYSASNFKITPPGDGAWIVKNSWGTDWGDEGYYYVSYYDSGILKGDGAVAFEILDFNSFDKVYQYDVNGGITSVRKTSRELTDDEYKLSPAEFEALMDNITVPSTYANTYKATGDDVITAVGTYMSSKDKNYTIWISVNGKEVFTQSGKSSYRGFEVISLNNYVSINKGDEFTVKIESFTVPQLQTRNKVQTGMSWGYNFEGEYVDLTLEGSVASIKAYAVSASKIDLTVSNVSVVYGNNAKVTVSLTSDNVPVVGASVKITFNGKTYTGVSDKKGKAVITVPVKVAAKKYTAKATFADQTKSFKITVKKAKPKITAKKKTFKKSKKVKKYTVKLKDNKGKAIKKARVTLKIKGKSYKAKTNAKGKAIFKIKKLTKKGTFKAKITYKGNKYFKKATKTVKIKIKK